MIMSPALLPDYSELFAKLQQFEATLTKHDHKSAPFFCATGELLTKLYCWLHDSNQSIAELKTANSSYYNNELPENYHTSFANPKYCEAFFDDKDTALFFSALFYQFQSLRTELSSDTPEILDEACSLFLELYELFQGNAGYGALCQYLEKDKKGTAIKRAQRSAEKQFKVRPTLHGKIIESADLTSTSYLYRYGGYISERILEMASFSATFSRVKIKALSKQIITGYFRGFEYDNKDLTGKSSLTIHYPYGFEILVRQICLDLKKMGYTAIFLPTAPVLNRQMSYDHAEDKALYLSDSALQVEEAGRENALSLIQSDLKKFSGIMRIFTFGEESFSPSNNGGAQYSKAQHQLLQKHHIRNHEISQRLMPQDKTSFTVISFPSPEIGDKFEEIFEAITEVNLLQSEAYEAIQKRLIDVMDTGHYAHIKGCSGNETDLKVQLQTIANPETETNFLNGGATLNIPAGELFTTPQLTGTNGLLHIRETYLQGFRYQELKLRFVDGVISEFSCSNYPTAKANQAYIIKNLFANHETVPMGEFAIGTNTLAFATATKYNILDKLPILISEKMGPHFAVGDPCFARGEDRPVYNPIDNKEVTARANEKTACGKENPAEAYVNCHTDITLPYGDIEFLKVITDHGNAATIIKNGRFVVPGTEILNAPLISNQ